MDPMAILLGAKTAFEAIKVGVQYGKELHGMVGDVTKLLGAVNDLTRISANPQPGWFDEKSAEQLALDAFMAKKEAEDMQEQVKNLVLATYGVQAWDQIQREIIRIRKEQKAAAIQAAEESAETLRLIFIALPLVGVPLAVLTIIIVAIWRN
jgi:hypothetical protein